MTLGCKQQMPCILQVIECRLCLAFYLLMTCYVINDTMQCNAMQCNAMQCNAMQCNAMQCNAMQCNAMQCNAMQCNAMQCNSHTNKTFLW